MAPKQTEANSLYNNLETMSPLEIASSMNNEDQKIALAVKEVLPQIANLIQKAGETLMKGHRIFYIGAGTSGRLGVLDASECPPTFGVESDLVNGIIAGGDLAIRKAVEGAEDSKEGAWLDLLNIGVEQGDLVIGIAASGTTPYVVSGLRKCQEQQISTGCITCNPGAPVIDVSDIPIIVNTGPEFLTGSSRLKAGTAQKMVLNMVSTGAMIIFGRVKGNKMVDMRISNDKLHERAIRIICELAGVNEDEAKNLLLEYGNVRGVLDSLNI